MRARSPVADQSKEQTAVTTLCPLNCCEYCHPQGDTDRNSSGPNKRLQTRRLKGASYFVKQSDIVSTSNYHHSSTNTAVKGVFFYRGVQSLHKIPAHPEFLTQGIPFGTNGVLLNAINQITRHYTVKMQYSKDVILPLQ